MLPSPIKTPEEMLFESAGIPHMQAGGQPPQRSQAGLQALMAGPRAAAPSAQMQSAQQGFGSPAFIRDLNPPNPVEFFRYNPGNRFGAKDRLETISSAVDKDTMTDFIRAMRAGEKYGVPQLPPEYLASMLMKETRSDFGYNEFNKNNPRARMIAEMLMKEGFDPAAAGFGAAIFDKMQVAQRLKVPFAQAWNGMGVNRQGQTGAQYAQGISGGFEAVMNPRNQPMLSAVREAYNYQPQPPMQPQTQPQGISAEGLASAMPQFNVGGSTTPFYDMSKMVIQKHLSGK